MDNKFLNNGGKNKFFEEEVDDEEFLRHPKSGSSGYMLPQHQGPTFSHSNGQAAQKSSLEQQRQQLAQRRRELEERTLASSERGLGLLHESEKVGVATAEELSRQKEQLVKTEQKLDDINSSLRSSEKHIQGIRSVFGSIKNYFSGHSTTATSSTSIPTSTLPTSTSADPLNRPNTGHHQGHPAMRGQSGLAHRQAGSVDEALDRNLDDMASGLARLKGLAQGLNSELSEHNQILDRVYDKTEVVGFKVDKQNKDMNKILKK